MAEGSDRHLNESQFSRHRGRPRETVHKVNLSTLASSLPSHSKIKHRHGEGKLGKK